MENLKTTQETVEPEMPKIRQNRIYRSFEVMAADTENGNDNEMWVEGKAVSFDSPTVLFEYGGTEYKEKIDRHAFDNANMSDVIFNYNHGHVGRVMARTKNGTLELTIKEDGLYIRANLAGTEQGRQVYKEIKDGYLTKMSFQFAVKEESYDQDNHTYTIYRIKRLFDVSVVDIPAYDDTSIEARRNSIIEAEAAAEKEAREAEADESKRQAEAELLERKLRIKKELLKKGLEESE